MLADTHPIIRTFPDGRDITIYPIGDLHIGSEEFMETEWNAFCARLKGEPDSYVVIIGDMLDNGTKSSITNSYRATLSPRQQKAALIKYLTGLEDKIICGTAGNHEFRSVKDVDNDALYDVFVKLDIEDRYRANGCFSVLRFGDRDNRGRSNPAYTLAALHGAGGGMYIGSGANRLERFGAIVEGLDVLVTGHTHKPITFPSAKLVFDAHNKQVTQRQFRAVVATSWTRYGDYAMRKMLPPVAHCLAAVKLCGTKKQISVEM